MDAYSTEQGWGRKACTGELVHSVESGDPHSLLLERLHFKKKEKEWNRGCYNSVCASLKPCLTQEANTISTTSLGKSIHSSFISR